MSWAGALAFGLKHWRALSLAAVLLALAGWHWQDKISDWFDARKIARLEKEVAALRQDVADQAERLRIAGIERQSAADLGNTLAATRQRMRNDDETNRAATARGDLPAIVRAAQDAAGRARAAQDRVSAAHAD